MPAKRKIIISIFGAGALFLLLGYLAWRTTITDEFLRVEQGFGQLPSDPAQTILGSDADVDGVRDDIRQYIAALSDTVAQKNALRQMSKSIAGILSANPASDTQLDQAAATMNDAVHCVYFRI